jgi:hypothetical protein
MSSISEESETGDDDHLDDEFIVCNNEKTNHHNEQKTQSSTSLSVHNCLGDLNTFKKVRISLFFIGLLCIRYISWRPTIKLTLQ